MEVIIVALIIGLLGPVIFAIITLKVFLRETHKVAIVTNDKLDIIHVLVNSNMTASMQAELDATVRELAMMHEVVDLKRKAGHEPTAAALIAIDATEAKVTELKAALDDRLQQNDVVEKLKEG